MTHEVELRESVSIHASLAVKDMRDITQLIRGERVTLAGNWLVCIFHNHQRT